MGDSVRRNIDMDQRAARNRNKSSTSNTQPVSRNDILRGRVANRRIEITISKADAPDGWIAKKKYNFITTPDGG